MNGVPVRNKMFSSFCVICSGLIVRLRFPAGDKNSFKPTCGLGHGMFGVRPTLRYLCFNSCVTCLTFMNFSSLYYDLRFVEFRFRIQHLVLELKEIDIDLIDIKEELGRGQFGVTLHFNFNRIDLIYRNFNRRDNNYYNLELYQRLTL